VDSGDTNGSCPLAMDRILSTQTVPRYKTVFLQRLANPSLAYDPVNNPYRTVDWMPIDLTVFNGEDTPNANSWHAGPPTGDNAAWDPDDPNVGSANPPKVSFGSRQRGTCSASSSDSHYGANAGNAINGTNNIWAQISDDPVLGTAVVNGKTVIAGGYKSSGTVGTSFFGTTFTLANTLGYINTQYQKPLPTPPACWNPLSPGFLTQGPGVSSVYYGDPIKPFPWLTWNARPFISELELMLVPASHPGRLLWENSFGLGSASANPYITLSMSSGNTSYQTAVFPHTIDFFQSQTTSGYLQAQRLLEYVCVPSRFPCSEIQVNPNFATGAAGQHSFHIPFNRIPIYREPGRINLNTISSPDVFFGLMNYFPGMANLTFWDKFVRSRRGSNGNYPATGYTVTGTPKNDIGNINSIDMVPYLSGAGPPPPPAPLPTYFGMPFRSANAASMLINSSLPAGTYAYQQEIDATVLRADPDNNTNSTTRALFQFDQVSLSSNSSNTTLVGANFQDGTIANTTNGVISTDVNPYFRYQGIQRLGNLVTTRSNVFAVWITVGYFEALPAGAGYDPKVYPDGYQLGQELGSDTGDITRHRAFYIFDRSIPVGFQRGQDINQDKALLLRRYIE
jgi:hypothetical protein